MNSKLSSLSPVVKLSKSNVIAGPKPVHGVLLSSKVGSLAPL